MSEQKTQSKAEARRERNSEANHLGMDTAAAGMAAGGLGLALLHQQASEAKAATMDGRNVVDPASATVERSIDGQPDRTGDHATLTHDDRSELQSLIPDTQADSRAEPQLNTGQADSAPRFGDDHDHGSVLPNGASLGPGRGEGSASAAGPASVDHSEVSHSLTGGLQNLVSGASSAVTDMAHGLEQRLDAITSATSEAIDASLTAVSQQLSSLTSHIGDLVAGHGDSLSQAASATAAVPGELVDHVASAAPAIVDPIFHQAFGPASDSHAFAGGVVDTGGLASFGSTALDAPISFLGQSYTDVADHTVHGLQGLTHGLV